MFVKIRPLMDGNNINKFGNLTVVEGLKSDHWWMEIKKIGWIYEDLEGVKIRPLMDGN